MSRVTNSSVEGNYCGRAVHGVSNLGREEMREIEAHRSKERPTPWAHLALRYNVNVVDLRRLFEQKNDNAPAAAVASPVARDDTPTAREDAMRVRDLTFRALWAAETPRDDIMAALGISASTVDKMRLRLRLPRRVPGRKGWFWTAESIAYVRRHYFVGGESANSVGRHLGCAHTAVLRLAREKGWDRKPARKDAA
jgi:hypothetical protein